MGEINNIRFYRSICWVKQIKIVLCNDTVIEFDDCMLVIGNDIIEIIQGNNHSCFVFNHIISYSYITC